MISKILKITKIWTKIPFNFSEIRPISENDRPLGRHTRDLLHGRWIAAEDRSSGARREAGGRRVGRQARFQRPPQARHQQEHAAL